MEIDLKDQECYFYDEKKMPENYLNNIYTDRKLINKIYSTKPIFGVLDSVSSPSPVAMKISTPLKNASQARKKDNSTFVREYIDRVEVEREFDPRWLFGC